MRRSGEIACWLCTGIMFAVMPKCPMCLAAYVTIGTGIGLSFSTAWYLQLGLTALCMGSLLFLTVRLLRRSVRLLREDKRKMTPVPCCKGCVSLET